MAELLFGIGSFLVALGFFKYGRYVGLLLIIISFNLEWGDYSESSNDETCIDRGALRSSYEVCYPNE